MAVTVLNCFAVFRNFWRTFLQNCYYLFIWQILGENVGPVEVGSPKRVPRGGSYICIVLWGACFAGCVSPSSEEGGSHLKLLQGVGPFIHLCTFCPPLLSTACDAQFFQEANRANACFVSAASAKDSSEPTKLTDCASENLA